jgi:PilZ domain
MKSTHPDADRRTSPRFACALETFCRLLGPRPEQVKARVLDVSSGGVALWLNRWYDAGTSLAIDLPTEKGNPDRRPAVVKIQYAVPQGDGWWMAGASFARDHNAEELKALL